MNSSTAKVAPTTTRRTSRRIAPALALATLAAVGVAQPAPAAAWEGDSVVGGGLSSVNTFFSFDAVSSADGTEPMGSASFNNAGVIRAGTVTCLKVVGNAAVLGVKDVRPGSSPVYRQFLVIDHGQPTASGAGVDEMRELGAGSSTNRPCTSPSGLPGYGFMLKTGDIVVHDATA
jgi:hypothetical protein